MSDLPPLVSETDIYAMLESILINDEVVGIENAHILMMTLRNFYEDKRQALHPAAEAALGWIDGIYPPDIFIGQSEDADEGVKQIAAIRENLRQALAP